jgi:hypothetical protein
MNIVTTMKNFKLMKLLLPLILICIVSFGSASRSSAQISDVFSTAFKSLAGFNFWIAQPNYVGKINQEPAPDAATAWSRREFAYSVKFTPLAYGAIVNKDTHTTVIQTSFRSLSGSLVEVTYDTTVLGTKSTDTLRKGTYRVLMNRSTGDSLPRSITNTYFDTIKKRERALSLSMGYAVTPSFEFKDAGLTASSSISSLFLTAVTRPFPGEHWFSVGMSLYLPSLSNVPARYSANTPDTGGTRLRMTSATTFAPEFFLSINTDRHVFSFLPEGFEIFLDGGYKWQRFRSVTYTGQDGKEPANVSSLPTVIDAINFYVKVGLSFNVFGS